MIAVIDRDRMTPSLGSSALFARLLLLVNLLLFAIAVLVVYELQTSEANAYLGYRGIGIDPEHLVLSICSVLVVGALMPTAVRRPSDFFSLFHGLFVAISYAVLFPIRGSVGPTQYLLNFSVLLLPLLAVRLGVLTVPGLRLPSILPHALLETLVVATCLFGVIYVFLYAPSSAGIDIETAYERRIEGREIFKAGTLMAYLSAATINGLAPFAAFIAGWGRRRWLLAASFGTGLAFFYVLGLKAPVLYIALAYVIGGVVRKGRLSAFVAVFFGLLWTAMLASWVEYGLTGHSLIEDYFIRRAFAVPPFVVTSYFELMFQDPFSPWSPMTGVHAPDGITYFIGERYLGIEGLNANTNAFVYQLAAGGLPMYAFTVLLVSTVFMYLDATFRSNGNGGLVFVGFLFAILLVEQAATTALVSSGIGALIVLASFARSRGRVASAAEDRVNS